jgi:dTDP-glucose 4,6-dehydratase
MTAERFVVLGSNSFTGSSFVAELLRQGAEVLGVSRSEELDEVFLPYRWGPCARFRFCRMDLNRDLDRIDALLRDFQPDYVVNFAAQGMVAQSWSQPEHWFQTNTVAMVRLHERLRTLASMRKFVQASTPEVYGPTAGLVTEAGPFNPSTPYAVSKAACDMSLLAFHKAYGFPVAFTRSANVCGPGQPLYRILPKTVLCVSTGRKLKLEGGGRSVRSFIHVADVVEGTLRVARAGRAGEAYHLATDRNRSIRDLVAAICAEMGAAFDECVEVTEGRLGQDAAYLLHCAKAKAELDWVPARTVEDAIRDTIAWVQANLERLRGMPDAYVHKE